MFKATDVARMLGWTLGKLYRRVKKGLRPRPASLRPMMFTAAEVADTLTQERVKFTRKHEKRGRKKLGKYPKRAVQKKRAAKTYKEVVEAVKVKRAKRYATLRRYGLLRWGG